MLPDRADACLVNLPDPARYGLQKLLVAAERGPKHAKCNKDIVQALALIGWHLERAPVLLMEHVMTRAWNKLVEARAGVVAASAHGAACTGAAV